MFACVAGTRKLAWLHSDVRRRTIPPSPPFDMGGLKLLAPFKPQEKTRDVKRTPRPGGMLWVFSAGFLARARDPCSHLPGMSDRVSIGPVKPRRGPLEVFPPIRCPRLDWTPDGAVINITGRLAACLRRDFSGCCFVLRPLARSCRSVVSPSRLVSDRQTASPPERPPLLFHPLST